MKKVWMLIVCLWAMPAIAEELFSRIKLNPQFEQYLKQPQLKSSQAHDSQEITVDTVQLKKTGLESDQSIGARFRKAILGVDRIFTPQSTMSILGTGSISPLPEAAEESELYQQIRNQLEASHQQIGMSEVANLNELNRQFNLGSQNFSGFSWQKPFGVIGVHADRQVTPNLFGDNWLIQDTFTFEIQASTFLEKLKDAGLSTMSDLEIGAFAGITFKRVYTNYHYAPNQAAGLVANFRKLFLPFVSFNEFGMEGLGSDEIMKREDTWTVSAGGLITSPPVYSMTLSGGVLAQLAYQHATNVQSTPNDTQTDQRYRISTLSKKTREVGISTELQVDFYKLLKLTLLRFDLTYEYASGKEFTLAFTNPQWSTIKLDQSLDQEFRKIIRGSSDIIKLEPYVVRLDETSSSELDVKGTVLIWGRLKKTKTEHVRVIKDETVRIFFRNYSQSVKYVQNFFSRLFSTVIYKLLKLPVGVNNTSQFSRELVMEYEATNPQAANPKVARVDSAEQFSFVLTQSYEANRTHRWIDRRIKKDVIWFVDKYTTLPKDYKTTIRSELLRGPMKVESNLRVEKDGFKYLLALPDSKLFGLIADVCDSRRKSDWMDDNQRPDLLKRHFILVKEHCVKKIGSAYIEFRQDYFENNLKPSLAKFKSFMTKFYAKSEGLVDLASLFGPENTFIHGQIQATTQMGQPFMTTFSNGQFRGLGVIDNSKREEGSRAPASIATE